MNNSFNEYKKNPTNIINDIIRKYESFYSIPYDSYIDFLFNNYNIKYKTNNGMIFFECKSLQTLKEFIENNEDDRELNHNIIIKLIYDTGILIKNLEEDKRGIFCFSLDDYVVINNDFFFFINGFKLSNIYKNQLMLKTPIDINENFINKDEVDISHLPIKQYYKNSYYSFGLMVFYLLTYERYYDEKINRMEDNYPPIYYFLLRCLNDNPNERYFIYI